MLVLSRYVNEVVMIGDDIRITVVAIRDHANKVRLGIEAPTGVPVHRLEVYEAIQRKQREGNDGDDS